MTSGTSPAFPPEEYAERLGRLRSVMRDRDLAVLAVVGPENVYYLSGLDHQGHFAFTLLAVPAEGDPVLVTREMERPTVAAQTPGVRHVTFRDGEDPGDAAAAALLELADAGRGVAVELGSMSLPVQVWRSMRARLSGVRLTDGTGIVDELRAVKSAREIEHVRRAAAFSDAAMQAAIDASRPGVNELEVVAAIYDAMIRAGSEYPGNVPLVRSRDRLLQEHVSWRDHTLETGDALFAELSGSAARYHAPTTRMVYLGSPPAGTDVAAKIALDGLEAVREALRPGALAREVYAAWQAVVHAGLGNTRYRRHHCGYLTGIGFPPSWVGGPNVIGLRHDSDLVIAEGMVCHVLSWLLDQEPADYVVSDTILVTKTGGELLTGTDRGPLVRA
jgi:Xaa-Pro dipeptidase